jgi:hypothetical protein
MIHIRKQNEHRQSVCDGLSFVRVVNGKVPCIYTECGDHNHYYRWNNMPGGDAKQIRQQKNLADHSTFHKRTAIKKETTLRVYL